MALYDNLGEVGRNLRATMQEQWQSSIVPHERIDIAMAYVSLEGLDLLLDDLEKGAEGGTPVRLIIGAEPLMAASYTPRLGEDDPEGARLEATLERAEKSRRRERDQLAFDEHARRQLERAVRTEREGRLEVRIYRDAFMHAKLVVSVWGGNGPPHGSIVAGSGNLTAGGLLHNLEVGAATDEPERVCEAAEWFGQRWEEAEGYRLEALYGEVLEPWAPWDIYRRILLELFGGDVEEREEAGTLPSFQKHGVERAMGLLERNGGVMIADEVGLGKTYMAGEMARRFEEQGERVLVVGPRSVVDQNWKPYRQTTKGRFDTATYEGLAQRVEEEEKAGWGDKRPLARGNSDMRVDTDHYKVIVLDEAHNYRNEDVMTRSRVLEKLRRRRPRHFILLTATPVNNSLEDLEQLIGWIVQGDSSLQKQGVPSIARTFALARKTDPDALSPDQLFEVIDACVVKRTRAFVKAHYPGTPITIDGKERIIEFPKTIPETIRYEWNEAGRTLLERVKASVDPENEGGPEALEWAMYGTTRFRREGEEDAGSHMAGIQGLMRSGVLKALESSAHALKALVDNLVWSHETFLKELDTNDRVVSARWLRKRRTQGTSSATEATEESWSEAEEDPWMTKPAGEYRREALEEAVTADLERLKGLRPDEREVQDADGAKLAALLGKLEAILTVSQEGGGTAVWEANERKVLVFTDKVATATWLKEAVAEWAEGEGNKYTGRVESVTGENPPGERDTRCGRFAPVSVGKALPEEVGSVDVLIATNVLSEGVNLQQAGRIVSFDMPWNPMRLVQRHGRIDRIGSLHPKVYMSTFFPGEVLDELIGIEERIRAKLTLASRSVGVGTTLKDQESEQHVFNAERREMERVLSAEESFYERARAGQSGEHYRQILREAKGEHERLQRMPYKAGTVRNGAKKEFVWLAEVGRNTIHHRTMLASHAPQEGTTQGRAAGLRKVECEPGTEIRREKWGEGLFEEAEASWKASRKVLVETWNTAGDEDGDTQMSKPQRALLLEIEQHTKNVADNDKARKAAASLREIWPRRKRVEMLRETEDLKEKGAGMEAIYDAILGYRVEAQAEEHIRPAIREDDVRLICWMAIVPEDETG